MTSDDLMIAFAQVALALAAAGAFFPEAKAARPSMLAAPGQTGYRVAVVCGVIAFGDVLDAFQATGLALCVVGIIAYNISQRMPAYPSASSASSASSGSPPRGPSSPTATHGKGSGKIFGRRNVFPMVKMLSSSPSPAGVHGEGGARQTPSS